MIVPVARPSVTKGVTGLTENPDPVTLFAKGPKSRYPKQTTDTAPSTEKNLLALIVDVAPSMWRSLGFCCYQLHRLLKAHC